MPDENNIENENTNDSGASNNGNDNGGNSSSDNTGAAGNEGNQTAETPAVKTGDIGNEAETVKTNEPAVTTENDLTTNATETATEVATSAGTAIPEGTSSTPTASTSTAGLSGSGAKISVKFTGAHKKDVLVPAGSSLKDALKAASIPHTTHTYRNESGNELGVDTVISGPLTVNTVAKAKMG